MTLTRRGRLTVFFSIVGLLFGGGFLGTNIYLRSVGYWGTSDPGEPVTIEIPKGAGTAEIGEILAEAGVIDSATGFRIAAFTDGGVSDIQAGKHSIATGLTAGDALEALAESQPQTDVAVNVTFPEGSWLEDFAEILEENSHLSAKRFRRALETGKVPSRYLPRGEENLPSGERNMEGLLFPSTYQVIERDTEVDVAKRLAEEFEAQAAAAGIDRAKRLGVTPYEAITIASMIEAEARHDEERPMIARVIYNRIEQEMKLEIDATVYYALGEHKPTLTASDLEVESPYNTRKYPGIPPTPIGAPGAASLEAAVRPADGDWLFYVVSDCEGHHAFSEGYDEFLQNKAAYEALEC